MEPHEVWGGMGKRGNEITVEAKGSRQARADLYFNCEHAIEEEVELNCYLFTVGTIAWKPLKNFKQNSTHTFFGNHAWAD